MGSGAASFLLLANFLLSPLGGADVVPPPALAYTAAVSASDVEHLAYECWPGYRYTVSPYSGGEPKGWPGSKCEAKGSVAVCRTELPRETYSQCIVFRCEKENAQDCDVVTGASGMVGHAGITDAQYDSGVRTGSDAALSEDIRRVMQDIQRSQDLAYVNPSGLDFKATVLADPIPRADINAPPFTPDVGTQIERYAGPTTGADAMHPSAFDASGLAADAHALERLPPTPAVLHTQEVPAQIEATFGASQGAATVPSPPTEEREGYFSTTLRGADEFVRRNFDIKKWADGVQDFRSYLKERFPTLRSWLSE